MSAALKTLTASLDSLNKKQARFVGTILREDLKKGMYGNDDKSIPVPDVVVYIDAETWSGLGRPNEITVTL